MYERDMWENIILIVSEHKEIKHFKGKLKERM